MASAVLGPRAWILSLGPQNGLYSVLRRAPVCLRALPRGLGLRCRQGLCWARAAPSTLVLAAHRLCATQAGLLGVVAWGLHGKGEVLKNH